MSKSVWHYLWLIIMGDIPQITVFCKSWNIRQWTIFPFKIRKQEEWRGQLKLHSIHIYVLKWKPEPWFPCLDAWLSSDWVPDWSMTRWWGAWLHSFPLYSASLLQGVIRRAGRAPRSVAYWSLSLCLSWWSWVSQCWKTCSSKRHLHNSIFLLRQIQFSVFLWLVRWPPEETCFDSGWILKNYKSLLFFSSPCMWSLIQVDTDLQVQQPTSGEG